MKIAIMQPYLFPYISYFHLIKSVEKFVIFDDVNYIKKGWINRNNFLDLGDVKLLTFQLDGASQNKKINEIGVGTGAKKYLMNIQRMYQKAPYFDNVFPIISKIIQSDEKQLALFIGNSLMILSEYLSLNTEFIYSSELNKNNNLVAQDKILSICKILNADSYINPIGGKELYSKSVFNNNNISLFFIETLRISYKQFNPKIFVPYLSIIDTLMFNSKEKLKKLLLKFKLIQ